jgi:hypothetical protein
MSSLQPFGYLSAQLLKLASPLLESDEIEVVLRSHVFFRLVWFKILKKQRKHPHNEDKSSWIVDGGQLPIFDLLEELRKACGKEQF